MQSTYTHTHTCTHTHCFLYTFSTEEYYTWAYGDTHTHTIIFWPQCAIHRTHDYIHSTAVLSTRCSIVQRARGRSGDRQARWMQLHDVIDIRTYVEDKSLLQYSCSVKREVTQVNQSRLTRLQANYASHHMTCDITIRHLAIWLALPRFWQYAWVPV